jgi:hypothetical protein
MRTRRLLGWVLPLLLLCPWFVLAQGPRATGSINTLPNEGTVGTTLNYLAKKVPGGAGGLGQLRLPLVTDTAINLYVVTANAGTSGNAIYMIAGEVPCMFDNAVTGKAGSWVVPSATTPGRCHQQDNPPANGMVVGTLKSDNTTTTSPALIDALNQAFVPGSGVGTGTVTSVGLAMPAEYTVTGSPVTVSGVLTVAKATQTANLIYAGPASGGAVAPTFRAAVALDIAAALAGTTAAGDLTGPLNAPTVAKIGGAFVTPSINTPTTLNGDVADYAPAGPPTWANTAVARINGGSADRRVTGFVATTPGDTKLVCNTGTTNALLLPNQYTGAPTSAGAHRLLFGDDVTLPPETCKGIWYDGTTARWRLTEAAGRDSDRFRPMGIIVGDPDSASPLLVDGNDTPGGFINQYGRDVEVRSLACKADAGTPIVRAILAGGTATSILTADCTCGAGTWTACSVQSGASTPVVRAVGTNGAACLVTPCEVDFLIVTAGTATRYINITGRVALR